MAVKERKSHPLRALILLVFLVVAAWVFWVALQISQAAKGETVSQASAIAVFGAAEYYGRPSPVLKARLDQALVLYRAGVAPLVITLGGAGDASHSEGGVGHDYLLAHGVPESQIIAETQSTDTAESAKRLAVIAKANHLTKIVAVSDATHLFRIRELCRAEGLEVAVSPRAQADEPDMMTSVERYGHEILSYTAWRLHLH